MKKDVNKRAVRIVCVAVCIVVLSGILLINNRVRTGTTETVPEWLPIVYIIVFVPFFLGALRNIYRNIFKKKIAEDDAKAESDERGRAIEQKANTTVVFALMLVLQISIIACALLGKVTAAFIAATAYYAIIGFKELCKLYYKRKM
ncbi:MAG: hypothetical protein LBN97_06925 [Oscillospiraceae bacterium]|jgi:uncharacterized membrane protein|nr:hypothetical protein [Oscillospiraceae bacterium]